MIMLIMLIMMAWALFGLMLRVIFGFTGYMIGVVSRTWPLILIYLLVRDRRRGY